MPSKEQEGRMARGQETVTLWRFTDAPPALGLDAWQQVRVGTFERLADRIEAGEVETRDFIPLSTHREELGRERARADVIRQEGRIALEKLANEVVMYLHGLHVNESLARKRLEELALSLLDREGTDG